MIDICFCIVLYKTEIKKSLTVQTLLEKLNILGEYNILLYLHNNGPQSTPCDLVVPNNVKIIEAGNTKNQSLAKIYNNSIKDIKASYTCILDQDSELTTEYIKSIKYAIENKIKILVPIVYSKGEIRCPRKYHNGEHNGTIIKKECVMPSSEFIRTVGSGVLISYELCKSLWNKYPTIFDERFFIYTADTAFFYRIKDINTFDITIMGFIKHNMASLGIESKASKKFRQEDSAAGKALLAKYYKKKSFIPFLIKSFNRYIIGGLHISLFCIAIKTYIKGTNPLLEQEKRA